MKLLHTILAFCFLVGMSMLAHAADITVELDEVIHSQHREAANIARDIYRHPKETLIFFGLQTNMQVLEILPGRGWYTEILAPLLQNSGELTVASFGNAHPTKYLRDMHTGFVKKMKANLSIYNKVTVVDFHTSGYLADISDSSIDMVVTFRNTHNWIRYGGIEQVYASCYRVLKPGGILGVVQHRAAAGADHKSSAQQGYVPEKYLINLIENAGFELVKKSDINANPKDIKDYPEGVWSLPPTFREKDNNRDKYISIGESDRMTMKFIKI